MYEFMYCLLSTREGAWFIISVVSVCLSLCQTITSEIRDIGSSYLHIWFSSREYRLSSYIKVIRSRSRPQEQKRSTAIQYSCNGNLNASKNPDPRSVKILSPITAHQ